MNRKTDIFFDLDHTLWDFETNSKRAYRILFETYDFPFDLEDFFKIYHPINEALWHQYAHGERTKEEVKYLRLKQTFDALNIPIDNDFIHQLAEEYLKILPEGTSLFPGAQEVLQVLKPHYNLHLLTNGFKEVQFKKIQNSGLECFFKTITVSEETGKLKPHPDVFNHALKKAGTFAHLSVMVGDNLKADVLGAINVGMQGILFDPEKKTDIPPTVAHTIYRLTELIDIFTEEKSIAN